MQPLPVFVHAICILKIIAKGEGKVLQMCTHLGKSRRVYLSTMNHDQSGQNVIILQYYKSAWSEKI